MNRPMEVLKKMIGSVKKGGLIICVDVNREFENDGLYIDDIRMNDKVLLVDPDSKEYENTVQDFIDIHGLDKSFHMSNCENTIEYCMNQGVDRAQAEAYIKMKAQIADYFKKRENKSFLQVQGLLIKDGRK